MYTRMKHASKRDPRLIDFARQMRPNPTPSEKWLWNVVRAHRLGGFHFRRQVALGPYIADFVCAEAKVIVELDGVSHEDKAEYDFSRQR